MSEEGATAEGTSNVILHTPSSSVTPSSSSGGAANDGEPIITAPMLPTPERATASDPDDPLAARLHSPRHHMICASVSSPSEQWRYVDWNFHNMRMLIASIIVMTKNLDG